MERRWLYEAKHRQEGLSRVAILSETLPKVTRSEFEQRPIPICTQGIVEIVSGRQTGC
jgi:hypothetical protein